MSSDRPVWHQHSHRAEDRYVVALRGELDMGVVDELHELLTASIAQGPLIEVGLAAVTFIDPPSSAPTTAVGACLGVSNTTGHVHRVLDMTGVLPTLSTDPTPAP